MVIDFHTHTFPEELAGRAIGRLAASSRARNYLDGTAGALRASMREAGVDYSVLLPVVTRPGQQKDINQAAVETNRHSAETGLISFGGIHPENEDYRAILRGLAENGVRGVKIHPVFQRVPIDDIRYLRIIECAGENDMIVITHAGYDIGFPGEDFSSVGRIERMLDAVKPRKFVLAHMGQHELPGLHRVQHPLDPSYRREIFPREPYIIARMSYDNHVIFARAFYDAQIPDVVDRHPLEDRVNLHPSHAVLRKAPQNRPVILILGMDAAEGYQPRLRGMPVRLYSSLIDVLLLPGPGHNGQQHGVIHPRLPHGSPKRPGCAIQIVPGPGAGRQSADSPPGQLLGKCMCVEIDDHINPPFSPLPSSAGPAFFPYRDLSLIHI